MRPGLDQVLCVAEAQQEYILLTLLVGAYGKHFLLALSHFSEMLPTVTNCIFFFDLTTTNYEILYEKWRNTEVLDQND